MVTFWQSFSLRDRNHFGTFKLLSEHFTYAHIWYFCWSGGLMLDSFVWILQTGFCFQFWTRWRGSWEKHQTPSAPTESERTPPFRQFILYSLSPQLSQTVTHLTAVLYLKEATGSVIHLPPAIIIKDMWTLNKWCICYRDTFKVLLYENYMGFISKSLLKIAGCFLLTIFRCLPCLDIRGRILFCFVYFFLSKEVGPKKIFALYWKHSACLPKPIIFIQSLTVSAHKTSCSKLKKCLIYNILCGPAKLFSKKTSP